MDDVKFPPSQRLPGEAPDPGGGATLARPKRVRPEGSRVRFADHADLIEFHRRAYEPKGELRRQAPPADDSSDEDPSEFQVAEDLEQDPLPDGDDVTESFGSERPLEVPTKMGDPASDDDEADLAAAPGRGPTLQDGMSSAIAKGDTHAAVLHFWAVADAIRHGRDESFSSIAEEHERAAFFERLCGAALHNPACLPGQCNAVYTVLNALGALNTSLIPLWVDQLVSFLLADAPVGAVAQVTMALAGLLDAAPDARRHTLQGVIKLNLERLPADKRDALVECLRDLADEAQLKAQERPRRVPRGHAILDLRKAFEPASRSCANPFGCCRPSVQRPPAPRAAPRAEAPLRVPGSGREDKEGPDRRFRGLSSAEFAFASERAASEPSPVVSDPQPPGLPERDRDDPARSDGLGSDMDDPHLVWSEGGSHLGFAEEPLPAAAPVIDPAPLQMRPLRIHADPQSQPKPQGKLVVRIHRSRTNSG